MEKYVEHPRHIEFQVLGDEHGNVISLGERECSIQRRHQKLLEESPSPQVTADDCGAQIGAACKTLSAIGYQNAGTIEFLMDEDRRLLLHRDEHAHPGRASGHGDGHGRGPGEEPDPALRPARSLEDVLQGPVVHRGHAIECRINAEHPEKFTPSAGKITAFHPPGGTGRAHRHGGAMRRRDSAILRFV